MLLYARPSVVALSPAESVIRIPLRRRTRNHLGSMYFGALAVGADCAAGLLTIEHIKKQSEPVDLIFGEFRAEFLKRAEDDTFFTCNEGQRIGELVSMAAAGQERVETPVRVIATVPARTGSEPVATFELQLSLKRRIALRGQQT